MSLNHLQRKYNFFFYALRNQARELQCDHSIARLGGSVSVA